jgi:hypothetical protein
MDIVDETQFSFSMLTNNANHTKLSALLLVKITRYEKQNDCDAFSLG